MTYTFKLARRLAVSRHFSVLTTLVLLAACAGETTAPDAGSSGPATSPIALQVLPRSVVIETNQRVRFWGQTRTSRGDRMPLPVAWHATGGTINPDGSFLSTTSGTFKVIGRGRGLNQIDTSVVTVVSPPTNLARIEVTPDSTTLTPGATRTFSVLGYRKNGSTVSVGVNWSATGGDVDAAGDYTADSTTGSFRVIATTTGGTFADTAVVRINQPAPTLTHLVMYPASTSLEAGASQRFGAYGRNSAGDSVAVAVKFSATGGTISSTGLYTAGQASGTFRVTAAVDAIADSATVLVKAVATAPAPALTGSTLAFGPFGLFNTAGLTNPDAAFATLGQDSYNASNVVTRIEAARARGIHLILALTGGKHENYLSTIDGVYQFDRDKWEAKLQTFNTTSIRQAIAAGVADGTIIGASVMDEPNVSGAGDGNTWGPPGTMTKARVDSLCGDFKALFPTLPAGVGHRWDVFEPTKSYRVCDFITSQYSTRIGSVTTWRDGGLAMARRDGHEIMFSMNLLNGGTQDKDGTWDCAGTGGRGLLSPNCRMTAAQVAEYGLALGPAGCGGLLMWEYDDSFMANADNQKAFQQIRDRLSTLPSRPCRRH